MGSATRRYHDTGPLNVFLSYSTRDERDLTLARHLAGALRTSAVEVFFAEAIEPGAPWEERLVEAVLEKSTHFLLIASAAALMPGSYVLREIELARRRRARDPRFAILQLCTGRVEPPFPELQTVRYHEDHRIQWKIVAQALGIEPRTMTDGAIVPKLCDRKRQDAHFHAAFQLAMRSRPGIPQLYVIQGERGHGHKSLVDRFIEQPIRRYALHARDPQSTTVERKSLAWPAGLDRRQAFDALLAALFGEISSAYPWDDTHPLTAPEWCRLTEKRREAVLVIEHELLSTGWSRADRAVLLQYADFWRDVAAEQPKLQCVVFLEAVYASGVHEEKGRKALRGSIEALRRPARQDVTVLDELPWITPDDVDEWFDQCAADYDAARRELRRRELFGGESVRPMAAVERMLRMVQQELRHGGEPGGYV